MLDNPFILVVLPTVIAAGIYFGGVAIHAGGRHVLEALERRRWRRRAAGRRERLSLPRRPKPNARRTELRRHLKAVP